MTTRQLVAGILLLGLWHTAPLAADDEDACDPDAAMPELPEGFCAQLVAEGMGPIGHMDVTDDGDLYVAIQNTLDEPGAIAGLRDTDGDGRFDEQVRFGERGGIGLAVAGDRLFVAEPVRVLSSQLHDRRLGPGDSPQVIAHGFPETDAARALVVHEDSVFVSVATDADACNGEGDDPPAGAGRCPERQRAAGIWRFERETAGQSQDDAEQYATGLRNATAMGWNPREGQLYALGSAPGPFTADADAPRPTDTRLPRVADELVRIGPASDFGWPYCYFDIDQNRRVDALEPDHQGGSPSGCELFNPPEVVFPGAQSPTDMLFYGGHQFPERYRQTAFAAFAGSADSPPRVTALALDEDGRFTGERQVFAEGFPPGPAARGRAMLSLAQGPKGSLYLGDSRSERIWRIQFVGDAEDTED